MGKLNFHGYLIFEIRENLMHAKNMFYNIGVPVLKYLTQT